jgi:hypothetical protein
MRKSGPIATGKKHTGIKQHAIKKTKADKIIGIYFEQK